MLLTQSHIQTKIHTTKVIAIRLVIEGPKELMLRIEIYMPMSGIIKFVSGTQCGVKDTRVPEPAPVTVVDPVVAVAKGSAKADETVDDPNAHEVH